MADLASLTIKVDSKDVKASTKDLEAMASSANHAASASSNLEKTTKKTSVAVTGMNNAARQAKEAQNAASAAMRGMGGTGKLAGHHMQNLAFQLQDVVVGLQGGQRPMTVFMQQGSQIAGVMMQAGVGVGALTKAILGMIAASVKAVVLNPVFLGIAAAVGTVTAAVNFMASDITAASGVTVTAGDVMLGAFDTLRDFIGGAVTSAFAYFGTTTAEVWDTLVQVVRRAVNFIIGASLAVPRLIAATYDKIGPAIGDAFYSGANLAIRGLNNLVSHAVSRLNLIVDALNKTFGTSLPRVVVDGLSEIENPFAGAMSALGKAGAQSLKSSFQTDWVGEAADAIRAAAVNRANQRAAEETGKKIGKTVGQAAAKQLDAELKGPDPVLRYIEEMDKKFEKDIKKSIENAGKGIDYYFVEAAERAKASTEKWNNSLRETLDLLDDILKTGGAFGGFMDSLQNIFSGSELRSAFAPLKKAFKDVAGAFGKDVGKALGGAFKGAQVGDAMSGLMKGLGIKTSQTGAQLGGAVGGAFGGPLGAIGGSIVGGLIGGMFKSTPKASATVRIVGGEAMVASVTGNKSKLKAIASGMAGALIDGLQGLADQLGGALGDISGISIGVRKKTYRVDVTGQGRTKNMPKFQTEAEAVQYAMQYAIQQGALVGLREGTQALLRASGDLGAQVQKALQFENVFKELRAETDPLNASLEEINKSFQSLIDIFEEAGASADDFAKLQELYNIRRQKAIDEYAKAALEAADAKVAKAQEALSNAISARIDALNERIGKRQDAIARLQRRFERESAIYQKTIDYFRSLGQSLREFSKSIIPLNQTGSAASISGLRARFVALSRAALGGDTEAGGAAIEVGGELRDAIMASATSRTQMLRDLYALQAQTDKFAGRAEDKAANNEKRLAKLEENTENLIGIKEAAIRQTELQIKQLEQDASLLSGVDQALLSIPEAQRELAAAQAERDSVLQQVTEMGFQAVVDATNNLSITINDLSSDIKAAAEATAAASASANNNLQRTFSIFGNLITLPAGMNIPTFADGGLHTGGLRIVGENGPELESTGASRIYNANQLGGMMSGNGTREEVKALREEMRAALFQIAKNTGKTSDQLNRWDGDGLPDTRTWEAA